MKHPYALYSNSSILLSDILVPELPEEVTYEGRKLFVKDEFHITLVSARHLAEIINPDHQDLAVGKILQEFNKFIKTTPLEEYVISKNLRFVQTDKEQTIIVMAEVPNLDSFFTRLSKKFSMELPKQQTHVTLYRYPKDFIGIPIPSREILENLSRTVEMPELSGRLQKFNLYN